MRRLERVVSGACAVILFASRRAASQRPASADSARCDSVVASAGVDSVNTGIFLSVVRRDGPLSPLRAAAIVSTVGSAFLPPRPLRLSTFAGPPLSRFLRASSDSAVNLRTPTIAGVYRVSARRKVGVASVYTIRASLLTGFDSAAIAAIKSVGSDEDIWIPDDAADSVQMEIRFGMDSVAGARRLFWATFPRMPVVDAVPLRDSPVAAFPDDARRDSEPSGDIVLRFIVDREGVPVMGTVEVVRGHSLSFLREALAVLPRQRFKPAAIRGCAISQLVELAFNFINPDAPPWH